MVSGPSTKVGPQCLVCCRKNTTQLATERITDLNDVLMRTAAYSCGYLLCREVTGGRRRDCKRCGFPVCPGVCSDQHKDAVECKVDLLLTTN